MTVGLATLARGGRAVVLMADRRLTYGAGDLHAETWLPKIHDAGGGWHVLFAGDATLAEVIVGGARNDTTETSVISKLGRAMNRVRDSEVERTILMPRLLDRRSYAMRPADVQPLGGGLQADLDEQIRAFQLNCTLLACGYGAEVGGGGGIIQLNPEGMNHAWQGFACIGSGARAALSALIFNEIDPKDDIDVQLYQLLYAKSHAEMTSFVGYELDAWIVTPDRGLIEVDKQIVGTGDSLVDRVLDDATRLPFKTRPEWKDRPGWETPRGRPSGWEQAARLCRQRRRRVAAG